MAGVIAGSQRLVPVLLDEGRCRRSSPAGRTSISVTSTAPTPTRRRSASWWPRCATSRPGRARQGRGVVARPAHYPGRGPAAGPVAHRARTRWSSAPAAARSNTHRGGSIRAARAVDRPAPDPEPSRSGRPGRGAARPGRCPAQRTDRDRPGAGHAVRRRRGRAGAGRGVAAIAPGGASLRLAVQVDDPDLADLPWETLVLPGQDTPLVLQPGVQLHRAVAVADPVAVPVPGPLRILAVVASPDHGGGELLDYEAELARILQAVDPSRRRDGAYVRVLNWGTPEAIRAALAAGAVPRPAHLLPRQARGAGAGVRHRRGRGGRRRPVRRATSWCRDQGVPLVVLAGCSTALGARVHPRRRGGGRAGAGRAGPGPAAGRDAGGAGDDRAGHRPLRHRPVRRAVPGAGEPPRAGAAGRAVSAGSAWRSGGWRCRRRTRGRCGRSGPPRRCSCPARRCRCTARGGDQPVPARWRPGCSWAG